MSRSALSAVLDDDDFDLAGELLLSWPFLRKSWDDTASFAFAVLARVEDEVGVLPSLALDLSEYKKLAPDARKNYVAAVAYHTAYVMGLLCASMLRSRSLPQLQLSAVDVSPRFAIELLEIIRREERTPQWLRYIETLPSNCLASCTTFLLDVAIRRHVRKTDFGMVHKLISQAAMHGVETSSLHVQAAEILNRLASVIQPRQVAAVM